MKQEKLMAKTQGKKQGTNSSNEALTGTRGIIPDFDFNITAEKLTGYMLFFGSMLLLVFAMNNLKHKGNGNIK